MKRIFNISLIILSIMLGTHMTCHAYIPPPPPLPQGCTPHDGKWVWIKGNSN